MITFDTLEICCLFLMSVICSCGYFLSNCRRADEIGAELLFIVDAC